MTILTIWMMSNFYGLTEAKLFAKLQETYFTDLIKPEGIHEPFDAYSESKKAIIELKCRGAHYNQMLIEKVKWDKLALLRASQGLGTLYICSTPMGCYMWDLGAVIEPDWSEKRLPKTTEFKSVEWVSKWVGYLDIADAQAIQIG